MISLYDVHPFVDLKSSNDDDNDNDANNIIGFMSELSQNQKVILYKNNI